jgi:hypothetical protein
MGYERNYKCLKWLAIVKNGLNGFK